MVISGILVSARTSLPGSPSPTASPLSRPNHRGFQLWMGGGVRSLIREGHLVDYVGLYINYLEEKTVFLSLKTSQKWLCGTHVLIQKDNTKVMIISTGWGDQVQELGPIGPGDYSVVSDLEHFCGDSPYFRLRQCQGRSSLSPQSGASSMP